MNNFNITTQEVLERISRHCPEALSTYFNCLNRCSTKDGSVFFSKELVDVDMSEEWKEFRKNVKKLALENLLEWHPFNGGISITLTNLHDDE